MNKLNCYKIHLLLFAIAILTLQSCDLFDVDHTPVLCLSEKIKFIKKYAGHYQAYIIEYEFQNRLVYYINPGTGSEDEQYAIIDINCDTLGNLEGIVGNSIINGEDFYNNARKLRIIWKN